MSLLYRFKPQKDSVLALPATHLVKSGVTANEVTALGLCLALCAGVLAYYGHLYGALALFVTSALCDALDGSLSRTANTLTEFGLYFDGVADRFSELFFVTGAVLGSHVPSTAFIVIAGGFVLLLVRTYGHARKRGAVPTTFGRPERLALLVAGVLCPVPLDTTLFIIAGLCCVFSATQVIVSTPTRAKLHSNVDR